MAPAPERPQASAADAEPAQPRGDRNGTGDAAGDAHERRADGAPPGADEDAPSPDLLEALRQLGRTGRAGLDAAGDASRLLRTLAAADFALARSALVRSVAFGATALVCATTAWLLLMAALVAVMSQQFGLPWSLSLLVTAVLGVALACCAGWMAAHLFAHTRMQATRRQLARLTPGGLLAAGQQRPAAPQRADAAAED